MGEVIFSYFRQACYLLLPRLFWFSPGKIFLGRSLNGRHPFTSGFFEQIVEISHEVSNNFSLLACKCKQAVAGLPPRKRLYCT